MLISCSMNIPTTESAYVDWGSIGSVMSVAKDSPSRVLCDENKVELVTVEKLVLIASMTGGGAS
jgi:hypothetical protein